MGRAPCCDKANVKRGPWSPEEDDKLKSYIHNHGTGGNWISLPQKIGLKRCGKSCRLRWLNYLRPNIKHGGFTEDEDDLICSLYISIGSRWSIIAAQLPGRTDNDIKNYWNTRLKKKLLGRQRREQLQARRETKQNNNWLPQQVAAPPFQQAAVYSNITIDIPSTQNNNVGNYGNLCYRTCSDDNIVSFLQNPKNPMTSDFHGIGGILPNNDFQAYDNEINVISENIFSSSYSMPGHQQLDRILDSTFPAESAISCGDISCLVYPSYYEDVLQTKSHQSENCLFF